MDVKSTDPIYGKHSAEIGRITEQIKNATLEQVEQLLAGQGCVDQAWWKAWSSAWDALSSVHQERVDAAYAALDAALNARRSNAEDEDEDEVRWSNAEDEVWWTEGEQTILATLTQDDITSEQYAILVGPWEAVFGKVKAVETPQ